MSIVHIAFYPSDWLAGTRGMSDAETGVYITLIAKMYEMAGPIARDDNRLFRLCGCGSKPKFLKSLNYLLEEGKVIEVEGGLFNERVSKEIEKVTGKSSKAKAAAQSRWERKPNKINDRSDADALLEHPPSICQPEPEPEPEPEPKKEVLPPPPPPVSRAAQAGDLGCAERLELRERILISCGHDSSGVTANGKIVGGRAEMIEVGRWQSDLGIAVDEIVAVISEVMAMKRDGPPDSFRYFTKAMQRFASQKNQPNLQIINGGQHDPSFGNTGFSERSRHRPDPAIEQIARLAGLGQAPRDGGS